MDNHQRGRSPSAGNGNHIRHTPSPSPHGGFHQPQATGLGLDASFTNDPILFQDNFNAQLGGQQGFGTSPSFNSYQLPQQHHNPSLGDQAFLQAQGLRQVNPNSPSFLPQGNSFSPDLLGQGLTPGLNDSFDAQLFPDNNFNSEQPLSPSFIDPHIFDLQPQQTSQQQDSTDLLLEQMSATHAQHSPTPPHMLQPNMAPRQPSPHASPSFTQGAFPHQSHSRNTSLTPSSAAFPRPEWGGIAFSQHRRQPSDTYSDVSSSAVPSPHMPSHDTFPDLHDQNSPFLNPQADPSIPQDLMSFDHFSISTSMPQQHHISPHHSPHISPRLSPQQQPLPQFNGANGLDLTAVNNQFANEMFAQSNEPFPTLTTSTAPYDQQEPLQSPPEISIDFAPPSRQSSFEPAKPEGQQHSALSPPDRNRGRMRNRARSDPFSSGISSRSSTPARSPSLAPQTSDPASLSPNNIPQSTSRSPSPSGKSSRRSSTSSIPHRDYILDLADPNRPGSTATGDSKRVQKHPATFQCTLCPKRFTRAYNLRSHLRTHTDERPFVCTVCGKAFARQHDRKRHEGLHSGEKKFVCRGELKNGGTWGCGRRFARADALGRHFRSEAGRVCIKPLLDEEAAERHRAWAENNAAQQGFGQGSISPPAFDPYNVSNGGDLASYPLPAALLTQYPALAGIWDQLPANAAANAGHDEDGGRSSFDASSGGEYMEGEDDSSYLEEDFNNPAFMNQGQGQVGQMGMGPTVWAQQQHQQQYGQ